MDCKICDVGGFGKQMHGKIMKFAYFHRLLAHSEKKTRKCQDTATEIEFKRTFLRDLLEVYELI